MRAFKTKVFARFANEERISDSALLKAIAAAEVKPDADLGGGLIKQRVARRNEGKSGGYRTIIAIRRGDRAVFLFGFAKNDRENLSIRETRDLKILASTFLERSPEELEEMIAGGRLWEIENHDPN
ncbi:type II toxin-antitoxin system RelE/ParE family toxin [soil metagenome]